MVKRGKDLTEIVNSSVEEAVSAIAESHANLRNKKGYMIRHIDEKALSRHIQDYLDSLGETGLDETKTAEALKKNLRNYVLSGRAFDTHAQELILKKSLGVRERRAGDAIDKVGAAFEDIYEMFKTNDYAERFPELAKAAQVIHDYNFLNTAVDMLRHYEVMDRGEYKALKRAIGEDIREESKKVQRTLRDYVSRKAVAVILGLIGISFLISTNFTGAVIGGFKGGLSWIGIVLIAVSWVLMLKKK